MPSDQPSRPLRLMLAPLLLMLAACGGDDADWPRLMPTEALLAEPAPLAARPEAQSPQAATDPLLSRANALRTRADRLRKRPVIDPALLARMQAAGA